MLVPALSKQQGDAPDVLFGDQDERGGLTVDIADVWAVGARSDAAVYDEMIARVATLPRTPARTALERVADLDTAARGMTARPPAPPAAGPPTASSIDSCTPLACRATRCSP